jgi:hypothetical protein
MGCRDCLAREGLEEPDEQPLEVRMQEDVGFIEHYDIAVTQAEDMKEKLQPNLDAISSPDQFLESSTSRFRVVEVEYKVLVSHVAIEISYLDLRNPWRGKIEKGVEIVARSIFIKEEELIAEVTAC